MKMALSASIVAMTVLLGANTALADFYVIATPIGVGTRISIVPFTIDSSGFYYLDRSLTATGTAITITADNVTLDLMGFTLTGPGKESGVERGIDIDGQNNVEIRNGTVTNFGGDGINEVHGGSSHRIVNVRLIGNGSRGVHLSGNGHLVQNCSAYDNDFSGFSLLGISMVIGNVSKQNGGIGISVTGGGSMINNVVYDNTGFGFNVGAGGRYVFDGNTVYGNDGGAINLDPDNAEYGVNSGIP